MSYTNELEDAFAELDEFSRETEALYGTEIRSIEGDARALNHVNPGEYWRNNRQIVTPVGEDVVQAYLKKKDNQPSAFPKLVKLIFAALIAFYVTVHGIGNIVRTAQENIQDIQNSLTAKLEDTAAEQVTQENNSIADTIDTGVAATEAAETTTEEPKYEPDVTYYTEDGQYAFVVDNTFEGYDFIEVIRLTEYLGDATEATVPEEIDGYPVRAVARSTFSENDFIEKVVIEAKLDSIGGIFRDDAALRELVLPSSVKHIGYLDFYNTPSLASLTVSSDCDVNPQCAGYDVNLTINYVD